MTSRLEQLGRDAEPARRRHRRHHGCEQEALSGRVGIFRTVGLQRRPGHHDAARQPAEIPYDPTATKASKRGAGCRSTARKIFGHQGLYRLWGIRHRCQDSVGLRLCRSRNRCGRRRTGRPVLGSAIDPLTNTYLTYGPYAGNTLFRYDIEASVWTTGTMPFTEVDDGGMAYLATPGFEGVYMIQGEEGTGFARYTESNHDLIFPPRCRAACRDLDRRRNHLLIQSRETARRAGGVVLSDPLPAGTTLFSAGHVAGDLRRRPT